MTRTKTPLDYTGTHTNLRVSVSVTTAPEVVVVVVVVQKKKMMGLSAAGCFFLSPKLPLGIGAPKRRQQRHGQLPSTSSPKCKQ
jgi:hypothetical protein